MTVAYTYIVAILWTEISSQVVYDVNVGYNVIVCYDVSVLLL